jgi:hypothetical protein
LSELEEWGGVNRDLVLSKLGDIKDASNFNLISRTLVKALKDASEEI